MTRTYPPLPDSPDEVPTRLILTWARAMTLVLVLDGIMWGNEHAFPELTTGSELCICRGRPEVAPIYINHHPGCRYHFPTGRCRCVYDVTHPGQVHRIPNRTGTCLAHWELPEPPAPAVPRCSCMYQEDYTRAVLPARPGQKARRVMVLSRTYFTIDPWCPHHGAEPRWTPTDRPWETTLGPDETT